MHNEYPNSSHRIRWMPISTAIVPSVVFGFLTMMSKPIWPGIERIGEGYFILTIAVFLPLGVLCTRHIGKQRWRLFALLLTALASVALCFHAGIVEVCVKDIDGGLWPSWNLLSSLFGIFCLVVSVPIGLIVISQTDRYFSLYKCILVPVTTAVAGQLTWFTVLRTVEGPSGIELWLVVRVLIHIVTAASSGALFYVVCVSRTTHSFVGNFGILDLMVSKLPGAVGLSVLLFFASTTSSALGLWIIWSFIRNLSERRLQ